MLGSAPVQSKLEEMGFLMGRVPVTSAVITVEGNYPVVPLLTGVDASEGSFAWCRCFVTETEWGTISSQSA